jgi:hypothetical protein
MKATDNPPTQNPEDWTDIECAEGMLEVIENCGQDCAAEMVRTAMKIGDHAAAMALYEKIFADERGQPMPAEMHQAVSRTIEGALRNWKRLQAKKHCRNN